MTRRDSPSPGAWQAALFPLYAALFLFGTETFVIAPILPLIASEIGASLRVTASAAAAYVVAYAVLAPFLAYFSDAVDRRATLIAGLLIFVLGNVLAASAQSLQGFVAARALSGLGAALAGPAIWSAIVALAPAELRSRVVGFGMAAFSIGQVAGVPAGGALTASLTWRAVFLAIAAVTVLASLWVAALSKRYESAADSARGQRFSVVSIWRNDVAARTLVLTGLFHAANLGAYAYIGALFASRFALDAQAIGVVGVSVGAGSVLGAFLAGRLGDRARQARGSEEGRLPLWCALLAASLIATFLAPTLLLALLSLGLWFVASGAYVTDSQSIVTGSSAASRALASAWNTTAMHAGTAMGVFLLGVFAGNWLPFFGTAACLAIIALLFSFFATTGACRIPCRLSRR
ncbi:MFS transporter [Methylobacterium organophilum]|uniref:MFS transporter n=1 Tax=Methylobacterium organophilum TaxID=410 RepID=UPI001F1431FC|nr:MFS transporter [Methylobacterium organophilum]UMY18326.1 MFS transporter [Methylobacterium organophilum]